MRMIAMLMACFVHSLAQGASGEQAPVDAGAIIMPPAQTESGKKTPDKAEPKAPEHKKARPATSDKKAGVSDPDGKKNNAPGKAMSKKPSRQDDCKGPADLCKQESPR